jgi:hypothetical protein
MLWLIFKHLIPQTAFLPSQRPTIRHPDIHGRAAEKLLRLTPICCLEARNANILGNLNSSSNSGTNGKFCTCFSQSNFTKCPRTDLDKRFLPRPKSITA